MAARTTVCPGCREAVPGGRLSCPSCGMLLASVAGAPRRRPRKQATSAPPAASPDALRAASPSPAPAGAYVPPTTSSGPFLLPARAWAGITSSTQRPMAGLGSVGARPMATAGAGSGFAGAATMSASNALAPTAARVPSTPVGSATDATEVDADEVTWLEATAGWFMIIGSAVAMLGFLLPWSRTVIGAEGSGSYFDTWGIANPSHVMVLLALTAALGLSIVANPIPTWIRTSAVGLVLGGLLVGLTWPYLFGPLGAGPGVLAILVGGIMLGAAGVMDLVDARHARAAPPV